MSVKERIFLFLQEQGIKKAAFERSAGLSNGYLNNVKDNLSVAKVEAILRAYPNLSRNWLLFGEGEMLVPSSSVQAIGTGATAVSGNHNTVAHGDVSMVQGSASGSLSAEDIRAIVSECSKEVAEQCNRALETASQLMTNATAIMQNAIELNGYMKRDHEATRQLYQEIHEAQADRIERHRKWMVDSMETVRALREDIARMISEQTEETKRDAMETAEDIKSACKTADMGDFKDVNKKLDSILVYFNSSDAARNSPN